MRRWWPRGGVAVIAHAKVDGVESFGQTVGIPQGSHRQVIPGDWHEPCLARDEPQLRCVAILMPIRGYSLINLPNRQLVPVQVFMYERREHRRCSRAPADSQ